MQDTPTGTSNPVIITITETERMIKQPLPRVEIFPGKNGKFYFHKVNRNGRKTEPSQPYKERRYAYEAAKRDVPGVPIVHVYLIAS